MYPRRQLPLAKVKRTFSNWIVMMVSVVDLFSIDGGWGLVWPRCATYSNGTGALADPQGKPHGASFRDSFSLTTGSSGSSPKLFTSGISTTGHHITGGLKQLLLSHDPLWIVFVRGVFPDEPRITPPEAPTSPGEPLWELAQCWTSKALAGCYTGPVECI